MRDAAASETVDVEVRGLSKIYGKTTVLHDVSFRIPAGSTLSLLGPSGCGKSTTLSILAGMTEPQSGQVLFGGRPMNNVAMRHRRVGMVFQSYALFPHLTVRRNVEFGPRAQGRGRRACATAADHALVLTHLGEFAERKPEQLSGGQRQRVAIARALASDPQVLLMDEPLSSLDANLREQMRFEISDLQRRTGISMVFVTHDQQEAMAVGDQVGVLFDGRIRQIGKPFDLYHHSVDEDVAKFLGKANLLPVRVGAVHGGQAEVTGPDGQRWAATLSAGTPVAPGEDAVLMVRPEQVRVSRDSASASANSATGKLARATFLGREANIEVDLGGATLEVLCSAEDSGDLRPGAPVTVTWPAERSTVFARSGAEARAR